MAVDSADIQQRQSWGMILGERFPPVSSDLAAMDRLVTEAMVDEGAFRYGPPISTRSVKLPEFNDGMPDRSASTIALTEFYDRALDNSCIGEAFGVFRGVHSFLRRHSDIGGRMTLLEAPPDQWAENGPLENFLHEVHSLYGVRSQNHRLRNDPDSLGNKVHMAYSEEPFLLVERSVERLNSRGQRVVHRILEAADISDLDEALNELTLGERIRMEALLDKLSATEEQKRHAFERVNRQTIPTDEAVGDLLRWRHAAPESRLRRVVSSLAAKAVGKVLNPPGWFMSSREEARHRL